jgi:hypothetical protein
MPSMSFDAGWLRRLVSGFGGAATIVALLAAVALVVTLRGRAADAPPSTPPPQAAVVGASTEPTAEASLAAPTPQLASAPADTATPAPTPEPTAEPTPQPPAATPAPTSKPTPKPTKKPVADPAPEGTPRITKASGSFGQTLTVQGIKVRVDTRAPQDGALNCVTDDPDMQGWTELVSYELTMTWPDSGDAEEPWVAVGSKPWNVLQFDGPSPFRSGADYVVSTCHKPSDSDKVMVEISPPGSPIIYLRWFFN